MKLLAAGCIIVLGFGFVANFPATLSASLAAAGLTWAAMDWRYGKIIRAAKAAAHAFCFSDGGLVEIREMSKIILTWRGR